MAHLPRRSRPVPYVECDDYERAIAELADLPINQRWQTEMALMMEVAHDYSGGAGDRPPLISRL